MTQSRTPNVRHHVVVNAGIERAFAVFTEQFGDFKPREHNLLAVPIAETIFEPHVGGHIYDRGVDGSVCRWARVLVYEPPRRLVFTWDIGPTWQLEPDQSKTSEVEVRFTAESDERTRVDLEHRHLDRHGPGWQSVADAVDGDAGWPLYLGRYVGLFAAGVRRRVWGYPAPSRVPARADRPGRCAADQGSGGCLGDGSCRRQARSCRRNPPSARVAGGDRAETPAAVAGSGPRTRRRPPG